MDHFASASSAAQRYGMRLRAGDPRAITAAALGALVLCAGLSMATAPSPTAAVAAVEPRAVEPVPTGPVRMLDGAPRSEQCEEQTWPYIDRRCLRRAAEPRRSEQDGPASGLASAPAAVDTLNSARIAAQAEPPAAADAPNPPQETTERVATTTAEPRFDPPFVPSGEPRAFDPRLAETPPVIELSRRELRRLRALERRAQRRARHRSTVIGRLHMPY
jgi:hypothetical protein